MTPNDTTQRAQPKALQRSRAGGGWSAGSARPAFRGDHLPDPRVEGRGFEVPACWSCWGPGRAFLDMDAPVVVHQATVDDADPKARVLRRWSCALPPRDEGHPEVPGRGRCAGVRQRREEREAAAVPSAAPVRFAADPGVRTPSGGGVGAPAATVAAARGRGVPYPGRRPVAASSS